MFTNNHDDGLDVCLATFLKKMYSSTMSWNPISQWSPPWGKAGTAGSCMGSKQQRPRRTKPVPAAQDPSHQQEQSREMLQVVTGLSTDLSQVVNSRQHWFHPCSAVTC